VHTGQHYDSAMSDVFFDQLGLPAPDVNLEVRSGSHAQQTAEIMARFEPVVLSQQPDVVLVYGDVNSTMAAALVCAKLQIPLGHVEAGLRALDRTMPEEVNRVVTDQLADFLFTPSEDAGANLQREGIAEEKIYFVGNVMMDSLAKLLPLAESSWPEGIPARYALVTLHRPANVDQEESVREIVESLLKINQDVPVIFPAHPRTQERMARFGMDLRQLRCWIPCPIFSF
jgi:UDP-N-acetylglucosamine 2-epimerase (non-hydrolysing)